MFLSEINKKSDRSGTSYYSVEDNTIARFLKRYSEVGKFSSRIFFAPDGLIATTFFL